MPEDQMPQAGAPAPEQEQAPKQGGARELIADIHEKLSQLSQLVQGAPVEDADKEALAGVLSGFESFVDGLSGGGAQAPQKEVSSPVPMEAGAAKVKPVA